MKFSGEPSLNSKWIHFPIPQQCQKEKSQNKKIYLQHPIQPSQNNEYEMEGLDDGLYNQAFKMKELKDQLNTPRNNEKLLKNHIQQPIIYEVPKLDLISTKGIPYIHLIDQFQPQQIGSYNLLNSNSILYQIFTIILFFMNTIAFIMIPLQSFREKRNFVFQQIYIFFILIQMVLNLIKQDKYEGITLKNILKIINNYLKSNFILDLTLFILIILDSTINENNLKVVTLLINNLIIQINRCKQFKRIKIYYSINNKLTIFLTHLLNYMIILNLLACLGFLFAKEIDFFESNNHCEQYFLSIYSVIQMNSHIIPQSSSQAIGLAIVNVVYIFLNAYILLEFYHFMKMDESLCKLYQYFNENKPDLSIKLKILDEVDKTNSFQFYTNYTEKLIELLEKQNNLTNYFSNLSQKTINNLVQKSSIEIYQQNQDIIQENQIDDSSIYFLLEGDVKICSKNSTDLQRLNKSSYFGELSFYTNQLRTATVKSPVYCRVLKLSRKDFLSEATFLEKQTFFQAADQILQKLKMPNSCFCCKSEFHYIRSCPSLTYYPESLQILQKSLDQQISLNQKSNKLFRRHRHQKQRIPYTNLKQMDPKIFEFMMKEQSINSKDSSSLSSEQDLPYENDTFKQSNNTSSEKLSTSAKNGESQRIIGIDYDFLKQSKYLQTILEKEEENESPSFYKEEKNQNFVTKSQDFEQNNTLLYQEIDLRQKSKSYQCIAIKNGLQTEWPVHNFQNDFENTQIKVIDTQIHGFERMDILEAYFPHNNFNYQIHQANLSIKNKQDQYQS